MRRALRQIIPLSVLLLALAACGDDDTGTNGDDGAAPATEDASGNTDDDGTDEGADGDDVDDEEADDDGASGSAVVTWDGETFEYESARCAASVSNERFQMRASGAGEDRPDVDIRFELLDDEQGDFTRPTSVAIFFNHGATIGEGEGYEARGDDAAGVEADETGTSGSLELEPDSHSMADEVNPDGGTLEFELVCP